MSFWSLEIDLSRRSLVEAVLVLGEWDAINLK